MIHNGDLNLFWKQALVTSTGPHGSLHLLNMNGNKPIEQQTKSLENLLRSPIMESYFHNVDSFKLVFVATGCHNKGQNQSAASQHSQ